MAMLWSHFHPSSVVHYMATNDNANPFLVIENASLQLCLPICMDWHTDHSVIKMALHFYYMYICAEM